MAIHRRKLYANYSKIDNDLMYTAKTGMKSLPMHLLCIMLSCRDDFQFSERGLTAMVSEGRKAVHNALKELEAYGYLHRKQIRDERGKFIRWEWDVYSDPWFDNAPNQEENAPQLPSAPSQDGRGWLPGAPKQEDILTSNSTYCSTYTSECFALKSEYVEVEPWEEVPFEVYEQYAYSYAYEGYYGESQKLESPQVEYEKEPVLSEPKQELVEPQPECDRKTEKSTTLSEPQKPFKPQKSPQSNNYPQQQRTPQKQAQNGSQRHQSRPLTKEELAALPRLEGPTVAEVEAYIHTYENEAFCFIDADGTWSSWYWAQAKRGWRDRYGMPIRSWRGMLNGFADKYMKDYRRSEKNGTLRYSKKAKKFSRNAFFGVEMLRQRQNATVGTEQKPSDAHQGLWRRVC